MASTSISIVPSPPSAAGQRSARTPACSRPRPIASAASGALRVPLNESGATRKLRVEGVDVLLELVGDDVALDLHGRSQLARLLGEVMGQDLELLHLLHPSELLVDRVQVLLDHGPHALVVPELRWIGRPALLLAELGALLHVEGDQRD